MKIRLEHIGENMCCSSDTLVSLGKDRVQGKIRELEAVEEQSKAKAAKLNEEPRGWD